MSRVLAHVHRALLFLYPKGFRRDYGDEMVALLQDELRFGDVGPWRASTRMLSDVARTAPRMRLESNMTKVVLTSCAIGVAVIAALIGSPILLVGLVLIAVLVSVVLLLQNPDRAITAPPDRSGAWFWWLLGAAALGLAGFVVLAIDGDELTEIGWPLLMLSWSAAIVVGIVGVILAVSHFAGRRTITPPAGGVH